MLPEKPLALLLALLERPGDLLTREELRHRLWPDGTFVDFEDGLNHAVRQLREILDDDARCPTFVETVPRRGYRYVGPAEGGNRDGVGRDPAGFGRPSPYPGLSSFTEGDAEIFFGREAEVGALWERLRRRRLLALIGPSGAGKTSFVRAGVVPARPEGWGAIVSVPGRAPLLGLAQALAPEVAGDVEAVRALLHFENPDVAVAVLQRWGQDHARALLVVDQFEELFTLSPPETQTRFAEVLGRLSENGAVHVLLSLRDDFLIRCHEHEAVGPVFAADLTPLLPLRGEQLRRALEEPATREGFAFEDDSLVADMLESVEGERGVMPLLAFAVSRLWEKRDRQRKLLTRAAYEEIGGVAGALAQHAEQTLERIGVHREAIVRELFRNLVTAQGTRAGAGRKELLSVLPGGDSGAQVLDRLVDARLLTSYEAREGVGDGGVASGSRHRIEIVHESLLRAWPRLVRWRAQDEEGAVLRDQLRQAAHLWEEKERPEDLLWTGTSERELELWRERYPGRLTALEEEFAETMFRRARRRARVRHTVVASIIVGLLGISAIIGGLWRHAAAEARRAEASKLLALGRLDMEAHPTAALAYARRSLELADTPEARAFALEVLWTGPTARILPVQQAAQGQDLGLISQLVTSPDGRWLALSSEKNRILLIPRDGGPALALPRLPDGNVRVLAFGPGSDLLITGGSGESLRFWVLPEMSEIRSADLGGVESEGRVGGERLVTLTRMSSEDRHRIVRVWPLPEGEPVVLGRLEEGPWDVDPTGAWLAFGRGRDVRVRPLHESWAGTGNILGSSPDEVQKLAFSPAGDSLASIDQSDEIRLWSLTPGAAAPIRVIDGPEGSGHRLAPFLFSGDGSTLLAGTADGSLHAWDLSGPPDARPTVLRRPGVVNLFPATSDPSGSWVAASNGRDLAFWPISGRRIRALDGRGTGHHLSFSADARWLVSCHLADATRLWPLRPAAGRARDLTRGCFSIATHPATPDVLVGTDNLLLVPLEGGPPRELLEGWEGGAAVHPVAFDAEGRRAFAGPLKWGGLKNPEERVFRIWDLGSGEEQIFSFADVTDASWVAFDQVAFAPDGSLFASGRGGVRRLLLPGDPSGAVSSETVYAQTWAGFDLTRDGRYLLVWASAGGEPEDGCEELRLLDLQEGDSRRINTHGGRVRTAALAAEGRIVVTADVDGVVRAGPATGDEPHLLLGQAGAATALGVSPDLRWIASWSNEDISLWPMPDVTKRPFHELPYDQMMAKLEALTNLQVVEDEGSSTGYRLEVGPFPGWALAPEW